MYEPDADLAGRLRRAVAATTATLAPPGAPAARLVGERVRRRALVTATAVALAAIAALAVLVVVLVVVAALDRPP